MNISNFLGIQIKQLELPFIETWIEQLEFQMTVDEETACCLPEGEAVL